AAPRPASRLLRSLDDLGEGVRVVHGEVGQDLAVERDLGAAQAAHQARVGAAVLAGRRVDAGDPEAAELALAVAAVAVRVAETLLHRVLGGRVDLAAAAPVALRHVQNLLPATARGY